LAHFKEVKGRTTPGIRELAVSVGSCSAC
jgi:hypothetical protein